MLRAVDEEGAPDGLAPTPGLGRLRELAERLEAAGLTVDVRAEGPEGPLPAGVDLAAYRIVQEAASNVLRHAGASSVEITVTRTADAVGVSVVDDGRASATERPPARATASRSTERTTGRLGRRSTAIEEEAPVTSGNGLRGIRERATALGGTADAGPLDGGGWQVVATLPVEAPTARRPPGGAS